MRRELLIQKQKFKNIDTTKNFEFDPENPNSYTIFWQKIFSLSFKKKMGSQTIFIWL